MTKRRKLKKKKIMKLFLFLIIICGCFIFYKEYTKKQVDNPIKEEQPMEEPNKPSSNDHLNKVINKDKITIKEGWQDLIVKYFEAYYKSLSNLETEDITSLFTNSNGNEAYLTQNAVDLLVRHHKMQTNDLSLTSFKYDINYTEVTIKENLVTIKFKINDYVKFKFLNDIESKSYDVEHTMVIRKTNNNYTIDSLRIVQGFYIMFTNEIDLESNNIKDNIDILKVKYLKTMEEEVVKLKTLQEEAKTPYKESKACDYSYNRIKATSYAKKYVANPNSEYTSFYSTGGNCQNFVSQSLKEGGIPNDYIGSYQWKYYSSEVNENNVAKGRTPSWVSTNFFYEYAKNNKEYGMCSEIDVNLFYAEPGDVIHVGYKGYSHATIVVDKVKDSNGNVIDLLINCNTVTLENYPVSAYTYSNKRLIKILGYNED